MREWVNKEERKRKEESQQRKRDEEEEKIAKRVRFMQEREYTEEDKAHLRELFGDDQPESKRKDESKGDESLETKRRRTQEEDDWHDVVCTSEDKA
eukprot:5908098-Karenia_brevis.AAC.1